MSESNPLEAGNQKNPPPPGDPGDFDHATQGALEAVEVLNGPKAKPKKAAKKTSGE